MPPRREPEDDKVSHQNPAPYTYIFSPVGIGRKEKREQWIWKDEIKESKNPQPVAYQCVIRPGPVPIITIRHPIDVAKAVPAQKQSSNRTKPPVPERYSGPATSRYHPKRSPSPRSTTANPKRGPSKLSTEIQRPNFEKAEKKPLPSLPIIEPASVKPKPSEWAFERSVFDGSESSRTTPTFIDPPPRSLMRTSIINPTNATPRVPRTPQIPSQSIEDAESIISPLGSMKGQPLQSPSAPSSEASLGRTTPVGLHHILQSQEPKSVEGEGIDKPDVDIMQWKSASTTYLPWRSSTPSQVSERSVSRYSSAVESSFDAWKESKRAGVPSRGRRPQLSLAPGKSTVSLPATSVPKPKVSARMPTSARSAPSTLADIIILAEAKPLMIRAVVASGTAKLVGS